MNIYPYVYRIDHPSGEFYIGYRAANQVPAELDLSTKYKTSSRHLSYPFEEYTQTILAEFYLPSGKTDAYDFEQLTISESWGDPLLANKNCHCGSKRRFSRAGVSHSEKTRAKMSAAKIGKPQSPRGPRNEETKQKISLSRKDKVRNMGYIHSEETRQKIRDARAKQVVTEEHKKKMSDSAKRRAPPSAETKAKISEGMRRRKYART